MHISTILLYNFLYILLTLIFSKRIITHIKNVKKSTMKSQISAAAIRAASIIREEKNEH